MAFTTALPIGNSRMNRRFSGLVLLNSFTGYMKKTARALQSVDPALKVGGDAKAFPYDGGPYLEGFIDYCAAHKPPLDFIPGIRTRMVLPILMMLFGWQSKSEPSWNARIPEDGEHSVGVEFECGFYG